MPDAYIFEVGDRCEIIDGTWRHNEDTKRLVGVRGEVIEITADAARGDKMASIRNNGMESTQYVAVQLDPGHGWGCDRISMSNCTLKPLPPVIKSFTAQVVASGSDFADLVGDGIEQPLGTRVLVIPLPPKQRFDVEIETLPDSEALGCCIGGCLNPGVHKISVAGQWYGAMACDRQDHIADATERAVSMWYDMEYTLPDKEPKT